MTIIRNLSIENYHAHDAVSSSKLKVFRTSPLLYKRTYIDRAVTPPESKALSEGAGFDCLVFDGVAAFEQSYAVKPATYTDPKTGEVKPFHGAAGPCKAWLANAEANGQTILDKDCWTRFQIMRQAITENPMAKALLSQGESQVTFRRESKRFGLEIQVRPDWFSEKPINLPEFGLSSDGLPYLVDLKTTADFNDWFDFMDPNGPRTGSPVHKFSYDLQASMAQYVVFQDVGKTAHFLLVIEKDEPFRVGVFAMNEEYLEAAFSMVEADLKRLAACKLTNNWPGSPAAVVSLTPPQWRLDLAARSAAVGVA